MDNNLTTFLLTLTYGFVAIFGGISRYLSEYVKGKKFKFSIFIASGIVSGFSGWIFAILGLSLSLPQPMLYVMAGTGGFFGEQTMKFILEYVTKKIL